MNGPPSVCAVPALAWIDATRPPSGWRLWGMNLVERQVRELALLGVARVRVWVSAATAAEVGRFREDFGRLYRLEPEFVHLAHAAELHEGLARTTESLLLLEGDAVQDQRILAHLVTQGPGTVVRQAGAAAAHLGPDQARALGAARLAGRDAWPAGLAVLQPAELDPYVPSLRLTMAPFLVRVSEPAQLRELDRLLYRRTFKGVIDAVALYGYYHLVRWITRQLSWTSLPPNLFTGLSILGIWAAVPCLAVGQYGWGVAAAWLGVIMDSVDGKLARLTLHLSDAMGRLEHLTAMPGLGLWYLGLGWHLSGRDLTTGQAPALATWLLLGAFLFDKVVSGGFRALCGRELFDYRPVDAAFHLVASRRNISLLILSVGVVVGQVGPAFALMAGWMAATLAFHLWRFGWVAVARFRGAG